ncbi:glyoxylate/succinic semialdehyde reductase 1 [Citrus sinensis]|uniref:6-phosphogluconate dehydrogenase NADP-binding domain-containing protein n=2 Tax=Citrus sinensis TaxID=2711 RepID=A0A067E7I7_CITSI|nr:glyoxylate/succinic semialdehyde reductase 1 [Citrus sinensis]KDO51048.1 hypothetical protein CISIN_1g022834mg [Citrus sinensis]
MEVGFLGLGIMGKAISMNLLRNGFKVTVWNRTLSKCDELVAHGATVGGSPAEVIKKCTITIGMLADPAAALSAITSKGGHFLEAPVSGSKQPAETGQLVILSAGEKALYDEAISALNVIGKKAFFLGEVGNGAKMKLVVNMIMGCMMNTFSEGLVLAEKSGLDPRTLLDVLDLGGIANPMFKGKGPTMLQSNYAPAFPLKHQQKDMRLALALGDENAVSMPIAAAANEAFKKARSLGLGDNDFSAVFEVVKDLKRSS